MLKYLAEQPKLFRELTLRLNFWIVLGVDVGIVVFAHVFAYLVRYEFKVGDEVSRILGIIPLVLIIKIPIFYFFRLYRGMWRYTSILDLINIFKAVLVSSGILIMAMVYANRFIGYSRSVFLMDGIFTFLLLCLHRGTIRYLLQYDFVFCSLGRKNENDSRKKKLLLVGAGAAAEKVIREIQDNKNVAYQIVGIVDDDPKKRGLRIHDIPILGDSNNLREYGRRAGAEEILIAITTATRDQMKKLIERCRNSGMPFKVLPSMGEIIKGKLTVSAIRDVDYQDLLGRPAVNLDQDALGLIIKGQTILVTGAGGSIGSELCRQLIRFRPGQLVLLDASEENLYKIQMELEHELEFKAYLPVLARVQDAILLDALFAKLKPSLVMHAAAYKHVPLLEANPWEAISNNVIGTQVLMDIAIRYKTKRFVIVSTDKAVRPTNVMGASKRLTELLMLANCKDRCSTKFMAVRFGNVLGSSGSIIPLFKSQIIRGGPVTVTHPDVTRYFMSIEEAAQLIIQAGGMGVGGEIFILNMGTPVKIVDLANDLITLMGYRPDDDIEVRFIGMRPGEKLFEELIVEGEGVVATDHEKIMVLRGDCIAREEELEDLIKILVQESNAISGKGVKTVLEKLVKDYSPDGYARSVFMN